jgi:hypothetical protein
VSPEQVPFGPGRQALLLRAKDRTADDLVADLALRPPKTGRPVIVVCGGAETMNGDALDRARMAIETVVASAAARTGAVVVDGGTAAGVMRLTGAVRATAPDDMPVLLGVAPEALVSYPGGPSAGTPLDEGHTHFVLAATDRWGGETKLLMAVAQALAGADRVAMLVAGGGPIAKTEVAEALHRRWPVFAITGTGGEADSIASHDGVRAVDDLAEGARQLSWELQDEPLLKEAWRQFATYDQRAVRLRAVYTRLLGWTLLLGLAGTFLALLHDEVGGAVLHWAVVIVPALMSLLIGVSSRKYLGQRWVRLRAAAESVKAEIYRFRAQASATADGDERLTARLVAIADRLMHTEAGREPVPPYCGALPPLMYGAEKSDDGLSRLEPERYLQTRVAAQLMYYRRRLRIFNRLRDALNLSGIVAGAAGTVLAIAGLDVWVSLTGGVSAAGLAYLGHLQLDSTIVGYNQALTQLEALESAWRLRRPAQQTTEAFERLVAQCESTMAYELTSWVKQLNVALADASAPPDQ